MQNNNQEYQVWDQLLEEESYFDSLAKEFLIFKNSFFIFNEYKILKNNDISKSKLENFKQYLLTKYGTLEIKEL